MFVCERPAELSECRSLDRAMRLAQPAVSFRIRVRRQNNNSTLTFANNRRVVLYATENCYAHTHTDHRRFDTNFFITYYSLFYSTLIGFRDSGGRYGMER